MTIACAISADASGTVLRLSGYLDCQSRALGYNGFTVFGGPAATALLSGVMTIFVAVIGYRMILGTQPSLRDGAGWVVRLGLVLALTTSWPAFDALIYRVATDAPGGLAAALLPAGGLSATDIGPRVQRAYDLVGHGMPAGESADAAKGAQGQPVPQDPSNLPAAPLTASLLALSSVGGTIALRLVAGILVALGPLVLYGLLFDGAMGIVTGWLRALVGAAVGVFATALVGAIEITVVEAEIARVVDAQTGLGSAASIDPQALQTTVGLFALAGAIAIYGAFRVAGAIRLPVAHPVASPDRAWFAAGGVPSVRVEASEATGRPATGIAAGEARQAIRTRATAISDALSSASRRDARRLGGSVAVTSGASQAAAARDDWRPGEAASAPSHVTRPASTRRTSSALRRDMAT